MRSNRRHPAARWHGKNHSLIDVMAEFSDYEWLVSDASAAAQLIRLATDVRPALAQLNELRHELSAERARLVVEQVELRRRAAAKFGATATRMFFGPTLLEQATDDQIARYKAGRFAPYAAGRHVHDYCCGIGGDLLALTVHADCTGWDKSPVACLLANANLRAQGHDPVVREADVETLAPQTTDLWHLDPDRRAGGRRSTTLEHHSPGPDLIDRWRRAAPDAAVKLSPATTLPTAWSTEAEFEWITTHRECRQLVVWFGALARNPGEHRATRLSDDGSSPQAASSVAGRPDVPCDAAERPLAYLYDPDPSVLAAGLLGHVAAENRLQSLGIGGAYLTGDRAVATPLLQAFAMQDCLPLRTSDVARLLAARNIGSLEIKKRGVTVDPDRLRRELKLRGENSATLILTRVGKRQMAIIAARLPAFPPEPQGLNQPPPTG